VEALYWRIRKFSGWVALAIGTILSLVAGFDLVKDVIESNDALHVAASRRRAKRTGDLAGFQCRQSANRRGAF